MYIKSFRKLATFVLTMSMVLLSFSSVFASEANILATPKLGTDGNITTEAPLFITDPVNLGEAGNYAILSKTGISTVPNSVITGDIGVSPISSTAITGFSLTLDSTNQFSTSTQVVGKVHAPDYTAPTPSNLTTAVSNMQTAYVDAAGRAANYTELYNGDISGKTLTSGVYKWGTGVLITSDVTLTGGPDDVWIFQIAKGITQDANTKIILAGGAQAKNIFWQTAGSVSIGTGAHFEGIILGKTNIALKSHASINGRLLAQTAVTLITNTVVAPVVTVSEVTNLIEFKEALANTSIQTINVTESFETKETILVNRPVAINGNNNIINFIGDVSGWQGNYVIEVKDTDNVVLKNIKLMSADLALLVNGSNVTLNGQIDVSSNEFAGIKVSKDMVPELNNSVLIVNATLINSNESHDLPTIYLLDFEGSVTGENVPVNTTIIPELDQTHYFIEASNAVEL
ncbi:MAG: ice-binding family protein [Acidaminobacteraceae bacterium]